MALLQMQVIGGAPDRNLALAETLIAEAARGGAALALLPEVMDLGWTDPSAHTLAAPIPDGEPCQRLMAAARAHGVYVCAGLTERAGESVYNSAVLLDPQGKLLLLHRKVNELAIGHPMYAQGDRLGVAHTDLGPLGLMICADGFARDQVLSRSLGYLGAAVILSPSAWAVPADHDNTVEPYGQIWRDSYGPVARDFALWFCSVSNVGWITGGPWSGRRCIGCSLVVDPTGRPVLQGPYGVDAQTILYVEVAPVPRPARGCGWASHWAAQTSGAPR